MAKVTIDGFETEVPDGTTILNAARQIGGDKVGAVGNGRGGVEPGWHSLTA